jgi:hypothetical protein
MRTQNTLSGFGCTQFLSEVEEHMPEKKKIAKPKGGKKKTLKGSKKLGGTKLMFNPQPEPPG